MNQTSRKLFDKRIAKYDLPLRAPRRIIYGVLLKVARLRQLVADEGSGQLLRCAAAAGTVAVCTSLPCLALSASDPIDTNRPSFMFSPIVMPEGSLQFENGVLYQAFQHRHWTFDGSETQVRMGILKGTELQMFVPNAFVWHTGTMTNGKVSDITEIGIKTRLLKENSKFNASFIGDVTVPTGSTVVSGAGTQAAFRLPCGYNIGQWAIMGMQSLLILNKGKNLQYFPDAMLNRNIGSQTAAFIEYGGFFTQRTRAVNIIHFGSVYKITPHQQVDIQFGFGLNKSAPTAFVGAGYSFRLDILERLKHANESKGKERESRDQKSQDNSGAAPSPQQPQDTTSSSHSERLCP